MLIRILPSAWTLSCIFLHSERWLSAAEVTCCCCWLGHLCCTQGVIFSYACVLCCVCTQRHWANAHNHQGDRPHGNPSHSQMWASPWTSSPLSLGEMPWLLSDFVPESRALSSCWDCLCNDDKELWVIRVGLCRKSFNLSIMNVVQLCRNILSFCEKCYLLHFLFHFALFNRWTTSI